VAIRKGAKKSSKAARKSLPLYKTAKFAQPDAMRYRVNVSGNWRGCSAAGRRGMLLLLCDDAIAPTAWLHSTRPISPLALGGTLIMMPPRSLIARSSLANAERPRCHQHHCHQPSVTGAPAFVHKAKDHAFKAPHLFLLAYPVVAMVADTRTVF
jgi:hypothetical protein